MATRNKKQKNLYLTPDDLKLLKRLADEETGGNESLQISRLIQQRAKIKRISLEAHNVSDA